MRERDGLVEGAHVGHAGQSGHGDLHRHRDEALYFFGARPEASAATCTWTFVTSGNASTESFFAARIREASKAAATATTTRCGEPGGSALNHSLVLADFGEALPLIVEIERAIGYDLFPCATPLSSTRLFPNLFAQADWREQKVAFSGVDEEIVVIAVSHDRGSWHHKLPAAGLSIVIVASMSGLFMLGFDRFIRPGRCGSEDSRSR